MRLIIGKFYVETSAKSELKSYSEAVGTAQKPVAPAFQSVKQAVQQVVPEEDRSRNCFVFGLEEENNENTGKVVDAVLESLFTWLGKTLIEFFKST